MKFGKVENIDAVDFELPAISAASTKRLPQKAAQNPKLWLGATGWSMPAWKGAFYPPNAKPADFLKYYSQLFSGIELNTTHYRVPKKEIIQKWYTQTTANFRFSPKLPQAISHAGALRGDSAYTKLFVESMLGFREKLGLSFMQLPPHFDRSRWGELQQFLRQFPLDELPLSVELRHPSWFASPDFLAEVWDTMFALGAYPLCTDVAGRRDVLHQELGPKKVAIRFVGNDLHATDYERLEAWATRVQAYWAQGVEEVYFFSHQPDNIRTPEASAFFIQILNKSMNWALPYPKAIVPPQGTLF